MNVNDILNGIVYIPQYISEKDADLKNITMIKSFRSDIYKWERIDTAKDILYKETGYSDWRVPTLNEMHALYRQNCDIYFSAKKYTSKDLSKALFNYTYWTSTELTRNSTYYTICFFNGRIGEAMIKCDSKCLMLVR